MLNRVEIAGVNTAKLPTLSNEEKQELLIKIKNGDKEAREKFIQGNLRLVLSVVQRFGMRGENPDDLFQVGCVGLIKAIDNFDINQDVQFSTYGVPMIIGEVKRYLRDNSSIRVSRSIKDLAYKVLAIKEKYLKESQKEISIEEIADILKVDIGDVITCLDAIQSPVSLQEPVYGDNAESIFLMDQVKDKKNNDEKWTDDITISEALRRLNEKEKNIIKRRFFDGRTQVEVAEEIGISQAQVSRLEKNALNSIRRYYK